MFGHFSTLYMKRLNTDMYQSLFKLVIKGAVKTVHSFKVPQKFYVPSLR